MHACEMASAQLGKDSKVMGVSLGSAYGVEDANKFMSRVSDRLDYLVDDRGVLVVEDLGCAAALAEVEVVRAGDGDDVYSGGRG